MSYRSMGQIVHSVCKEGAAKFPPFAHFKILRYVTLNQRYFQTYKNLSFEHKEPLCSQGCNICN